MIEKVNFTEVGNRIRTYREQCKMSQAELAEAIGTNQKHLSRIECGYHTVNFNTAVAIARALHISVDSLIADPSDSENESTLQEILNEIRGMNPKQLELLRENINTLKKLNE